MALTKNKKGFFFTSLTIIVLSLFLLTYSMYNEFKTESSEQKRIQTLDNFLAATETDLERQAYIMGFRAIFIIESKITESGTYSPSVRSETDEIIQNGTLAGIVQPLMIGATFGEIVAAANQKAQKLNAELELSQPSIDVFQEDPWHVIVQINTTLTLRDRNDKASWTLNKSLKTKIDVENFEDPLYILNTNGLVTNKFTRTPYSTFTQGSDVTNLWSHLSSSFYIASPLAPQFVDRLEGNLSPSAQGIESLVDLEELSTAGISVMDKSVVDHVYFSTQNPSAHKIQNMPPWFKIDDAHLVTYHVENLTL